MIYPSKYILRMNPSGKSFKCRINSSEVVVFQSPYRLWDYFFHDINSNRIYTPSIPGKGLEVEKTMPIAEGYCSFEEAADRAFKMLTDVTGDKAVWSV